MKQNKECTKKFEVYAASNAEGIIIYIGSGKLGRHKHCTSGVSNIYALNEMHFNKEEVVVRVLDVFNTKEESMVEEKKLILLYRPMCNTQYLTDTRVSKMKTAVDSTRKFREIVQTNGLTIYKHRRNKYLLRFVKFTEELLSNYKINGLISGIQLYGNQRLRSTEYSSYRKRDSLQFDLFHSIFDYNGGCLRIKESVAKEL